MNGSNASGSIAALLLPKHFVVDSLIKRKRASLALAERRPPQFDSAIRPIERHLATPGPRLRMLQLRTPDAVFARFEYPTISLREASEALLA